MEKDNNKWKLPFLVFILLSLLCGAAACINSFVSIDVYDGKAVAFRLIISAAASLLLCVFATASCYCRNLTVRTLWLRLAATGLFFVLSAGVVFSGYITPLPSLYAHGEDKATPFTDIRKAAEILFDSSEPCESFGFYSCTTYNTFLTKASGIKSSSYVLSSADGEELVSSGEGPGLYTVSYSPKTRLPYKIVTYDPNCGENVLVWKRVSDNIEDWTGKLPDIAYVQSEKLTHTFPRMMLRITKDGSTVKEEIYSEDSASVGAMPDTTAPGIYRAQLYAVFYDHMTLGTERLCPISNTAELEIS